MDSYHYTEKKKVTYLRKKGTNVKKFYQQKKEYINLKLFFCTKYTGKPHVQHTIL